MAAGDRTAELKIKATLEGTEKGAGQVANLTDNVKQLGDAAAGTAGDLARESSALDDTSASIAKSTQEAQEARQAHEAMGAAGSAAGGEIAAGAEKGTSATRELAQEADRTEEQAKKSAAAIQQFVSALTGRIAAEIAEMRQAGAPLEQIRAAYVVLRDEVRGMSADVEKTGVDGRTANIAIETAVQSVNAEIKKLDGEIKKLAESELPKLGVSGQEALGKLRGETITAEDALIAAATQIRRVDDELRETGRIGPRAINNVTQAVENYRATIIASRGSIEAARTEEIATLRVLETELERVTVTANRLTNASKDQREALKEHGYRIAGVAMAAQDLGRFLGPTGQALGDAAARVGILAMNVEQAKDAVHGMNLNTLQLGKVSATAGIQVAALIAALAGGAAIGTKFARASDDNSQSLDDFKESARAVVGELVELGDRFGAIQDAFSRFQAGQITGAEFLRQYVIGLREGSEAQIRYNAAIRDGASEEAAWSIALAESKEIRKFYNDAVLAGDAGNRLWRQGLQESQGDVEKLTQFVEKNKDAMSAAVIAGEALRATTEKEVAAQKKLRDELAAVNLLLPESAKNIPALAALADQLESTAKTVASLSAAERDRIALIAELLRRGKDLSASEKEIALQLVAETAAGKAANAQLLELTRTNIDYARSLETRKSAMVQNAEAAIAAARAIGDLEKAENGTTSTINNLLATLKLYVSGGAEFSRESKTMADALGTIIERTTRLTPQQREALEVVVQLAQRSAELTTSERAYAQALIETIAAGNSANENAKERIAQMGNLQTAITSLAAAVDAETTAETSNESAIASKARAAAEAMLAVENLSAADRFRAETIIELSKNIDELVKLQNTLGQQGAALAAQNADTAASEAELVLVKSGKHDAIQREIDATAELVKALSREQQTGEQLQVTHGELQKIVENGRTLYTNLTEEQRKATEQTGALDRASAGLGETIKGKVITNADGGAVAIKKVGDAAGEAGGKISQLGGTSGQTADEVLRNFERMGSSQDLDKLGEMVDRADEHIRAHRNSVGGLADEYDRLATSIARANKAAETATQ